MDILRRKKLALGFSLGFMMTSIEIGSVNDYPTLLFRWLCAGSPPGKDALRSGGLRS
jgi:hypothetical protein